MPDDPSVGPVQVRSWPSWLDQALEQARIAALADEVPVGALVVSPSGEVLGVGRNRREELEDPTSHAELEAIREAARKLGTWRLIGCTLVVTLEPCPMCLGASQQARIARIVYGAADLKGGALSLGYTLHSDTRLNHRFQVEHHPHPESGLILSDFFKKKRS